MPNLRIIYDNIADKATSLTASTTSGSLVASNMQTDLKSTVHRSTGLSVVYTVTWSTTQSIGGIGLPATNLSGDATVRVQLYSDQACTTQVADSGTIYACFGSDLELWNWSLPLNANAFVFGGASKTSVWFSNQQVAKGCKITLTDSATNTAGYIDCARLVIGPYWEPQRNIQKGSLNIEIVDTSTRERSDSGDLLATRSNLYDSLKFDLAFLEEADRQQVMRIARLCGTSRNLFITIFNSSNDVLAQDSTIYGKIINFATTQQFYGFFSTPLEIEGW